MMRLQLPSVLGEMPGRYRPTASAIEQGCPDAVLRARFVHLSEMHLWISFVENDVEVWRCNPSFFAAWFTREEELRAG